MKNKVKSFFALHKKILGIAFGGDSVKLAEMEIKDGKKVLTNLVVIPLVEDWKKQKEILQNTLLLNGFSASKAIVGIGGRNLFFREADFPFMDAHELREVMKWEIGRYIPYEKDTYYYDIQVMKEQSARNMKVLLVAGKKAYIDDLIDLFSQMEIEIIAIEGEVFGLGRLVEDQDCVIAEIGDAMGQIAVYRDGVPVLSRCFSLERSSTTPPGHLALSLSLADKVAEEVANTLAYCRVQNRVEVIRKVFVCGGNIEEALLDQVNRRIEQPAIVLEPLHHFTVASFFDEHYVRSAAGRAAVALGLLLRGGVA